MVSPELKQAERGLVELDQAFAKMKQTDFWVSPTFLDERLARFLERRQTRILQARKHSTGASRAHGGSWRRVRFPVFEIGILA